MYAEAWASDLGRVGPSEGELGKPQELQGGEHWRAGQGWEWRSSSGGQTLGDDRKKVSALPVFPPKASPSTCTNLYSLGCPEVRRGDPVPLGAPPTAFPLAS